MMRDKTLRVPRKRRKQFARRAIARRVEAERHDDRFAFKLFDKRRWAVDVNKCAGAPNKRSAEQRGGTGGGCRGKHGREV